MKRALIIIGALSAAACTTTGGTSKDNGTTREERSSSGGTSSTGGSGKAAAAAPVDEGPKINAKAKLAFEDALKAYDEGQKKGKVDYAQLDERFKHAAEADDNLAEAIYNRAVIAEKQGKTKDAISLYKEALSHKPSLYQAAENLGVIALNQGNEQDAQKIFEGIVQTYPEAASPRARLAEIARRHGEGEKAIQLAKEALFRDPKTLQAYKTMMLVNFEQRQFSMARLCALRATKIQENDPEIFFTLGLINLAEKEPAKARVQFKAAVAARPDFLPAHLELEKMAMAQEDYAGAEESIRQILRLNGKNAEALVDWGVALKGMGQYDKALEAYDAAQKVNPNLQAIYYNRGLVFAAKGDCDKALELYKAYISGAGGEGGLAGDHGVYKSIKLCEAAIQKREEDKKAAEEAAKMEAEMKKQEEAQKAAEKTQKEEDLKKTQQDARGAGAPPAATPAPAPKAEEKKPEAKKAAPAPAPATAPAAKKPPSDEPSDLP